MDQIIIESCPEERNSKGRTDETQFELPGELQRLPEMRFCFAWHAQSDEPAGRYPGGLKAVDRMGDLFIRNVFAHHLPADIRTAALDTETERIIQEAIHELSKGKTVIAIAHRLSTVLEADRIIVMKDGGIDAAGTHQELLQSSELYQRLYQLQFQENNAT